MPEVRIEAEPRTEFGKGASRRTRRAGRVPAVMYGHGAENRHFTLPEHELMIALKTPNVLIRLAGLGQASSRCRRPSSVTPSRATSSTLT